MHSVHGFLLLELMWSEVDVNIFNLHPSCFGAPVFRWRSLIGADIIQYSHRHDTGKITRYCFMQHFVVHVYESMNQSNKQFGFM